MHSYCPSEHRKCTQRHHEFISDCLHTCAFSHTPPIVHIYPSTLISSQIGNIYMMCNSIVCCFKATRHFVILAMTASAAAAADTAASATCLDTSSAISRSCAYTRHTLICTHALECMCVSTLHSHLKTSARASTHADIYLAFQRGWFSRLWMALVAYCVCRHVCISSVLKFRMLGQISDDRERRTSSGVKQNPLVPHTKACTNIAINSSLMRVL